MKPIHKKRSLYGGTVLLLILLVGWIWNSWFSTTRIAFINYQVINLGEISKANDNSFIRINELNTENLDRLNDYDMIFINAMGLRITEEQREQIRLAADKGLPVLSTAITNPANNICSLDSLTADTLKQYLNNGGRRNYRSLLNYVRKYIDRKQISVKQPEPVVAAANDMIYHCDPRHPEQEDLGFNTVESYNRFLKENGLWKEKAPRIVVTGQMGDPADLIRRLEETGNMVYPVRSMTKFVRQHIDSIQPSAVINMAHGRMGDYIVDYLSRQNIPLFAPLNVNRLTEEWENDPMGMNGGFLSQSVVTPEIDGAIRPFALFGHYQDSEGLQHVYAIPERLETFVETVNRYIRLQEKPNAEKRIAIYYYKGPGQHALTAAGMEVVPSLYNLLVRMKQEGYKVDNLPSSSQELERMIQSQGAVFNLYAEGAFDRFMETGNPELITREQYESWVKQSIRPEQYAEMVAANGEFPGNYMTTADGRLGVARLQFGNVVLLPQNVAGSGKNAFQIVHGTNAAPPHTYIASYLWTQYGFKADALIHFGTHGSLEFTPHKQVALSGKDWPDRLVGALPHFYIYSIGNVGEGIIAKRRAYAGLQSYLTPPFLESNVRGIYRELNEAIRNYNNLQGEENPSASALDKASLQVKALTVRLGIHRDLEMDSILSQPYTADEVARIESFAEELASEKITGQLYTMGVPYEKARIESSVYAMTTDPLAYSLLALDKLRGKAPKDIEKHRSLFTERYLNPAREQVGRLLADPSSGTGELVCRLAGISRDELHQARAIAGSHTDPDQLMAMMRQAAEQPQAGSGKGMKEHMKKMMNRKAYSKEEKHQAMAILEIERAIRNVENYRKALLESPGKELSSLMNALNGGYTLPSAGGDPIANPNTLPTGRNLYAINAEATPSEAAWEKGIRLANRTIELYRQRHHDSIPRKVSYTLWSGEFIETEGATIAQVLYMLGVEPVRDAFGRVSDLRLIPSRELGRPRIDVVVQTSGQLRDLAASRLFLISRAVEMAAAAKDDAFENQVTAGSIETERLLIEKGISPKDAREMSTYRVFGGMNGNYGTGITGMVEAGDRWENEKELADTYLNNMGAYYGSEKDWETFRQFAFEAALSRTDAVVQPRQSNTWGALSLDHVYEFMGGMNLAVRKVTGKDPDAYLSDYRNRNNVRMQEVKEAIGVESRTTIFNPNYIREKMKGESSSAGTFAEIIRNTYGWNVMKPKAVDPQMWNEIYEVYVKDKYQLNLKEYFSRQNPAALQEITAVMMETARKGMWKASEQQLKDIAALHTELVNSYAPACSQFVCDNARLRDFIASRTESRAAAQYQERISQVRESITGNTRGMVMKKEEMTSSGEMKTNRLSNTLVAILVAGAAGLLIFIIRRKRHQP